MVRGFSYKVKCAVCNKITAGRLPRDGNLKGDGSFYFPRRHKDKDGKGCKGNVIEGIIVNNLK